MHTHNNYAHTSDLYAHTLSYMNMYTHYTAPPNVLKKPTKYTASPEKLSFKEKLALHKKVAGTPGSVSPPKANGVRKQRPLSSALEVEHSMKRTSSDSVVVTSLANKIASFEAKAGKLSRRMGQM